MQMRIIQKLKSRTDLKRYLNTEYICKKSCQDLSLNTILPQYLSSYNLFLDLNTKEKSLDNKH